jgi:membrane-associated phospholipid phosphatase
MSSPVVGSQAGGQAARLRTAERLTIGFFGYTAITAFVFPLELGQRLVLVGLNLVACAVIVLLNRYGVDEHSRCLAVIRDWTPCILILAAYRESGLFFRPDPAHRLDYPFLRWDDALLKNLWVVGALMVLSPWLQRYLELAYLFCYPFVPLALGSLYLARRFAAAAPDHPPDTARRYRLAINQFWTPSLLAAFFCYVLYPFFPLTPPRELFHDLPGPPVASLLRGVNHWLLGRYAVGASLFPSAHVATVTAGALVLRTYLPRVGVGFLILAGSIALATVYGRYHYAADALAGALVGVVAFLVSKRIHKR